MAGEVTELAAKKRKFNDQLDDIFEKVLETRLVKQLDLTVACLERGMNNLVLRGIKVIDANAKRAVSFSRASLGMTHFESKYPLATIFARGHAVLKNYIQSDVSKSKLLLPADASYRKALELLLKFLDDAHGHQGGELPTDNDNVQEWQWTLELAQHVFSKLAVNSKYKYDDTLGCTCPVNETMNGERGDTSFGCENGWHGNVDILMADVPICLFQCEPDSSEPLPSSISDTDSSIDIEVKRSVFNDNDYSQIVAETITYSFLKNKDKSNEDVTLIPSIAINKEGAQCYFYDSINDVLLQSGYNRLVDSYNGKLEINTIVLIWLTLNHQLFCTGTLKRMKSSGFQELIDLAVYKEQVKAPCRVRQNHCQMCISDVKWSTETCGLEQFENAAEIPLFNPFQEQT